MSLTDKAFLDDLRASFRVEAEEHLQAMSTGLLAVEKEPDRVRRLGLLEGMFRAAHSLKGAARAVDRVEIETICQSMEDLFASWKRQEITPTRAALDHLHRALSAIAAALAHSASARGAASWERDAVLKPGAAPFAARARIDSLGAPPPAPGAAPVPTAEAKTATEQTVRMAVSK